MKHLYLFFVVLIPCMMVTPVLSEETPPVPEFFVKKKCKRCHDAVKEKSGPSLQVIATAYQKNSRLLEYFRGESEPIIDTAPKRVQFMKIRRRQIKKLSKEKMEEISNYIMSFKK